MTKSKLQAACPRRARPGLTLVELLVVVMIMAIMLAVAVPIVRPPIEARAVREAARMVNTALGSARTRAIQTGRPVGVMFEPLVAGGKTCAVLHYVQVSAPWSGSGTVDENVFTGLGSYASGGGVLKLNYQGPTYDVTSASYTAVSVPGRQGNGTNYDFQFYPPPKKSSLFPLQLPSRAVVDIGASGDGRDGQFTLAADTPVMVTFAPTGKVDRIYHSGAAVGAKLTEPLYLLVGKPGKTDYTAGDKEENNLLDGENIWIKLDPRTGAVRSAENKPNVNVATAREFIIDG